MQALQRKKTVKQTPKKGAIDFKLALVTGVLLAAGLIMLYSASTVESLERFGTTTYFLKNQVLQGALIGLLALYVCSKIDYHWWQKLVPVGIAASLILLVMVKVPGIGFEAGGADRWISVGPVFFQPSEIAKIVIVMYCAAWIAGRKSHTADFFSGVFPMLVIVGLFASLILWQPDFGTMISMLGTVLVMIIAAGVPWKLVTSLVASGFGVLFLLIKFEPYRAARLFTFLNPSADPRGAGYHITQALIAIGSGGLWGLGYGQSRQKHQFLPEVLGDSIFAVIAEELGFLRVLGIFALFAYFMIRGFNIAVHAPDVFGRLLAVGLTSMVIVQLVINVGSTAGVLPLTGIPLPFFSYGSTALIMQLGAVGILLQISRHAKLKS